ncbi:MAG: FAD-dependent monooxygenase [Verrucomicrobium sp.]|nr:FAD-dependent monooxygenase [Verrucomicrobium sp.]
MSTLPAEAEIVIVGAGPTGLALAAALRHLGVSSVLLLDAQGEGANTSRAAVVHARTLEVLEPLGVTPALIAEGIRASSFFVRDRDKELVRFDFDGLPTPYPYVLLIPQNRTEAILLDRLRVLGGEVSRPRKVASLDIGTDGIDVHLEGGEKVRAQWVVGCDGMHSVVREQAGIPFTGAAYEESFVLADAVLEGDFPPSLFLAPEGMLLLVPLPGGHHRVVATQESAPPQPDLADIQALLDARGPAAKPVRVREIRWSSRFRVHHRLAGAVRSGRVLLAGDAAHVHSPAGGQGMNTGLQDAVSLAEALRRALREGDRDALEDWEKARRKVARRVVQETDRLTRLATLRGPLARRLRNMFLSLVGYLAPVRQALSFRMAELNNR